VRADETILRRLARLAATSIDNIKIKSLSERGYQDKVFKYVSIADCMGRVRACLTADERIRPDFRGDRRCAALGAEIRRRQPSETAHPCRMQWHPTWKICAQLNDQN
jgi:hypothetical protein